MNWDTIGIYVHCFHMQRNSVLRIAIITICVYMLGERGIYSTAEMYMHACINAMYDNTSYHCMIGSKYEHL